MILKNKDEVKKWLRQLPLIKKEIELKTEFYKELAESFGKTRKHNAQVEYYNKKILELKDKADVYIRDTERVFKVLDDNERLVLTAKYIKMIRWDFIELHVYYSRRHAIRIHNGAIEKLVGQEVNEIE